MVQARFVRVWPRDAHHSDVPLRVELLGCEPGTGCTRVAGQEREGPWEEPSAIRPLHRVPTGTSVPRGWTPLCQW